MSEDSRRSEQQLLNRGCPRLCRSAHVTCGTIIEALGKTDDPFAQPKQRVLCVQSAVQELQCRKSEWRKPNALHDSVIGVLSGHITRMAGSKMVHKQIILAVLLALGPLCASAATPIRLNAIKSTDAPHASSFSASPLVKWWTSTTPAIARSPECMWMDYPRHDALKAWEIQGQPHRHKVTSPWD